MRKLLALAAACFVALSLFVIAVPVAHADCTTSGQEQDCTEPPAETQPESIHGRTCTTHSRANAQGQNRQYRTVCIAINRKDWPVPTEWNVEGLLSWDHNPEDTDHVRIYIDWIRLIRVQDAAVVKFKNSQGWFNVPAEPAPDAYGTSHDSWYAMCSGGYQTGKAYAKARYKLQWMDLPGQPVGDWKVAQSNQLNVDC